MNFVEVDSIPPPTVEDLRTIDACMERFPESLRLHLTGGPRYKEGLLRPEDLPLIVLGMSPSPTRKRDVDWLWYDETYRGFPVQWRRAYDSDPPVYDATLLIQTLSASLDSGECAVDEGPMSMGIFMNLLKYGPRSWQRDVLAAARWMPCSRTVHVTEPGLDLLMRVVPLNLRRALRMAGPEDDDADDLLKFHRFGDHGMWVMQGYKEDPPLFSLRDVAAICGSSRKQVNRLLKERPDFVHGTMNTPPSPSWGARRKELPAPVQEAKQLREKQEPPMPSASEEDAHLNASIEAANQRAGELRLQRRAGGTLASSFAPSSVGRTKEVSSLPKAPSGSKKVDRLKPPPQALRREKESREAFLKEAAPAFLSARTKDEAVHYDPIPDIEKALSRSLLAAKATEKKRRKALARHEARLRAQELLT
jgi:hypothetical protein